MTSDGLGRNMSLFLVMKKYDCNLRHHINEKHKRGDLKWKDSLILLTQLLEGKFKVLVRHRYAENKFFYVNFMTSWMSDDFLPESLFSIRDNSHGS